jgi:hypothetical protein
VSIEYIARTGKTYYLHVGQGKSGKPNYFFSMDPEGPIVNCLPEGFEIYENIGGQVFLRRKRPQLFTDEEIALVKKALKAHAEEWRFKIEIKKNALVIHETLDKDVDLQSREMPWVSKARLREYAIIL